MLESSDNEFYLCPGDELKALRQRIVLLEKLLAQRKAEEELREAVSPNGELQRKLEHLTIQNRTLEAEISDLRKAAAAYGPMDGMVLDTNGMHRFSSKRMSCVSLPELTESQQGCPEFSTLLELMNKHVVSYQTQITNLQNEIKTANFRAKKYEAEFEDLTKEALKMAGNLALAANLSLKGKASLEGQEPVVFKGVISCFLAHQAFLMQSMQIFAKNGLGCASDRGVETVRGKIEQLVAKLMGDEIDVVWDPDDLRVERAVGGFRAAINWGYERVQELEKKLTEAQATINRLNNEKNELVEIKFRQLVERVDPKTLISPQERSTDRPGLLQSELFLDSIPLDLDQNAKSEPFYATTPANFDRRVTKSTDASAQGMVDLSLEKNSTRASKITSTRAHQSILGAYVTMKNERAEAEVRPSLISSAVQRPSNAFLKANEPEKVSDLTSLLVSQKPQAKENPTLKYLDEIDRKNEVIAALENELRGLRNSKILPVLEGENKIMRLKVQNMESELQSLKKAFAEERGRLESNCQELVHEVSETKLKFSQFVMDSEDRIAAQGKRNKNLTLTVKLLEEKLGKVSGK